MQDDVKLSKQVSFVGGVRFDSIQADTENPSFVQAGYYDDFFDYIPFATPLYIPASFTASIPNVYQGFKVSASHMDPSFFGSLIFKMNDTTSFYLTYNHVDAVLGSSNFGGIGVGPERQFDDEADELHHHHEHAVRGRLQAELFPEQVLLQRRDLPAAGSTARRSPALSSRSRTPVSSSIRSINPARR